jgi:hypothetical protein
MDEVELGDVLPGPPGHPAVHASGPGQMVPLPAEAGLAYGRG